MDKILGFASQPLTIIRVFNGELKLSPVEHLYK